MAKPLERDEPDPAVPRHGTVSCAWAPEAAAPPGLDGETVAEEIEKRLGDDPSLAGPPAAARAQEFGTARPMAAAETGLAEAIVPETRPLPLGGILDDGVFG